jgi:hypothetical protein
MRTQRVSITVSLAALVVAFTSVNDAQARCENRLINKSFSCSFRSDFGVPERGQSCIEFSDDIEGDPPKFEASDLGENSLGGAAGYSCTCDPVGARFNRSRTRFSCAGIEAFEDDTFPRAMQGRIGRGARTITVHQVDILASSYVLRCDEVPSCPVEPSVQRSLGDNSVELQSILEDLRTERKLLKMQTE